MVQCPLPTGGAPRRRGGRVKGRMAGTRAKLHRDPSKFVSAGYGAPGIRGCEEQRGKTVVRRTGTTSSYDTPIPVIVKVSGFP